MECEGFGGRGEDVGFGYVVEERGGRREEAGIGHGEGLEGSGSDRHVRNYEALETR